MTHSFDHPSLAKRSQQRASCACPGQKPRTNSCGSRETCRNGSCLFYDPEEPLQGAMLVLHGVTVSILLDEGSDKTWGSCESIVSSFSHKIPVAHLRYHVSESERFENMGSVMEFKLFRNDVGRSRGMGRTLGVFLPLSLLPVLRLLFAVPSPYSGEMVVPQNRRPPCKPQDIMILSDPAKSIPNFWKPPFGL